MEKFLYNLLSDKTTGSTSVPLSWSSKKIDDRGCERIISFINDSFDIGIGSPDKWYVIMRREAFHKMIRWYLIKWSFGEWFGLRRTIWYWLLKRRCSKHKISNQ